MHYVSQDFFFSGNVTKIIGLSAFLHIYSKHFASSKPMTFELIDPITDSALTHRESFVYANCVYAFFFFRRH